MEASRIDRWLWAVRLCPSRSQATSACRSGHVRVNGRIAKPAAQVSVGDEIQARLHGRDRVVEVTRLLDTRVGAPIAVECYVDRSPPPPTVASLDASGERERGAGRPTKRERRQLDRWRSR